MSIVVKSNRVSSLYLTLTQMVVLNLLLVISAQARIPLGFTPVPITLQTLAVQIIAVTLGFRKGSLLIGIYLLEGLVGLPVFSNFSSGSESLLGITGGYLLGFLPATALVGYLTERLKTPSRKTIFFYFLIGNAVIYACGITWLSIYTGFKAVFILGALPFILGDVFKAFLGVMIASPNKES